MICTSFDNRQLSSQTYSVTHMPIETHQNTHTLLAHVICIAIRKGISKKDVMETLEILNTTNEMSFLSKLPKLIFNPE